MDEQKEGQSEVEIDPAIESLGSRLYELEKKYGLNSDKLQVSGAYGLASQLIRRLSEVEAKVGVDGLPVENGSKIITWQQAQDVRFLRKHGITIEDISQNRVKVQ